MFGLIHKAESCLANACQWTIIESQLKKKKKLQIISIASYFVKQKKKKKMWFQQIKQH